MPKLREVEAPTPRPRFVRYAEHQIAAVNHLHRTAGDSPSLVPEDSVEDDVMVRTEKALAALSEKFPVWMQAEWARLAFAHAAIVADGFAEDASVRFLQVARDIQANAPLFGYATAAEIAASLCKLMEDMTDREALPRSLVARHVDAIGAIARGAKNVPSAMDLRLSATKSLLRESATLIPAPSLVPE